MANPLLDALGTVGSWADTPGAYTRGLLAGRPGERASGRELLQGYGLAGEDRPGLDWGDVGGFATEAVLDPLSLIGPGMAAFKGIRGLTRGAQALSHADDANPLLKAAGRFAGDEGGWLKHPLSLGSDPTTNRLADQFGPRWSDDLDKLRAILGPHNPKESWGPLYDLRNMARMANPYDLPYLRRITSEMPDTTSVLGSGAESAIFKASDMGQDWAIGVGPQTSIHAPEFSPLPMIPETLQPVRTASAGGEMMIRHSPLVTPLTAGQGLEYDDMLRMIRDANSHYPGLPGSAHDPLNRAFMDLEHAFDRPGMALEERIKRLYPGANPWDVHPSNLALTREGNSIVLDAGAISHDPTGAAPFPFHAWDPSFNQINPAIARQLTQWGTPEQVRELMMKGLAEGTRGQGVAPPAGWLDDFERAMNAYRTVARGYLAPGQQIGSDVLRMMGR